MFYGCEKLKYINIKNAPEYDYNGDIIGNTPNNLVMCFNKTIASSLFNILKNKGCTNLDCSNNWKNNQNKIRDSNGECVPSCIINPNYRLYDYENTCYENCPEETIKNDDYTCKSIYEIEESKTNENMQSLSSEKNNNDYTTVTVSKTNNIIETSINSLYFNNCDIVSFFENKCEVNHKSNEDTKKLILDIITQIQDGSLDNLLRSIVQNGQSYIKNEKNEVYSITTTDYQEIKENKTIIDFGVCENILKDAYNIDKREELILFTVERYIPGYKIPIIEYGLFSTNGKINLDLSLCKGINIQTYIPVDINENELYKYDPSDKFFNDRCHKYTTENGTDITLYDRQKDYNDNNMSLCESH
jgi:hypothetical protein